MNIWVVFYNGCRHPTTTSDHTVTDLKNPVTGPEKGPQKVTAGKALAEKTKRACEEQEKALKDAISRAEKAEEKAKRAENGEEKAKNSLKC